MAISEMLGRPLPFLSLLLPLYLITLMSGFKKAIEVLPAILVSGIFFAFLQWFSSNYLGPALPDVFAGLGSIVSLLIFLKCWKPKKILRFPKPAPAAVDTPISYTTRQIVWALSPFILLTIITIALELNPVKDRLNPAGQLLFPIPGLHNFIS